MEDLFKNWNFIYENSEDLSLHVEYVKEGNKEPSFIKDVLCNDLKESCASKKAYHIEFDGSFELVIHAVKDNMVYVSFFTKASEYSWKEVERFVLSKNLSCKMSSIEYFGKPAGFYMIYVNEWTALKKRVIN